MRFILAALDGLTYGLSSDAAVITLWVLILLGVLVVIPGLLRKGRKGRKRRKAVINEHYREFVVSPEGIEHFRLVRERTDALITAQRAYLAAPSDATFSKFYGTIEDMNGLDIWYYDAWQSYAARNHIRF